MAILRTVHLLINSDDWAEASDIVSGLLSENGAHPSEGEPGLLDWGYRQNQDGTYDQGRKMPVHGNYEEGDFYANLPR